MFSDFMAFSEGDFVKVEYSAYRVTDNALVFTTSMEAAKKGGLYDEHTIYGPQLIVVGKGTAIKGLDQAIRGMSVDESKSVEIAPADAYGERKSELVGVISNAEFKKKDIAPYPGMRIELDGDIATVLAVNSGRVLVDRNHPLAGEKLKYEIKVVAKVDADPERVKAIAESYSLKPEKVALEPDGATILFGTEAKKDAGFFLDKNRLVNAVLEYMPKIKKVSITEEYSREKEKQSDAKN